MITGYRPVQPLEPETSGRLQWGPALGAGLLAGAVLLIAPRGSPWAALTSFSPAIMGRAVPASAGIPLPAVWLIHLGAAVLYGLLIARLVTVLHGAAAIFSGGLIGLGLYFVNSAVASVVWRDWQGSEVAVLFTHVVFGLIAAGTYRGLLRRKTPAQPQAH